MLRYALILSAALLASQAAAQQYNCESPQAQVEMNFCAHQEWKLADALLNVEYKAARAAMKQIDKDLPTGQQGAAIALRDAQRAWIKYRDLACAAEGWQFRGGSIEPLVVSTCLTTVTESRTEALQALSQTN